ncbi:hypothetical protein C8Q70DRAFT_385734 [Cubamyces menziesii]|nr:hypothetical protein C8Q70DRAFT_385734 [Cubamyces menziesii]
MLQLEELEERQERERGRLKGYIPIRRGLHAQSESVPSPAIADSLRTLTAAQPCSQCSASLLPRAFSSSVLVLLSLFLFSSADSKQAEQGVILVRKKELLRSSESSLFLISRRPRAIQPTRTRHDLLSLAALLLRAARPSAQFRTSLSAWYFDPSRHAHLALWLVPARPHLKLSPDRSSCSFVTRPRILAYLIRGVHHAVRCISQLQAIPSILHVFRPYTPTSSSVTLHETQTGPISALRCRSVVLRCNKRMIHHCEQVTADVMTALDGLKSWTVRRLSSETAHNSSAGRRLERAVHRARRQIGYKCRPC